MGPNLVTQNFGLRDGYQPQILGVVYEDGNGNGIYDPGEGFGDYDITVVERSGQTYTTKTLTAGGYQLTVPRGIYEVRVNGFTVAGTMTVGNVEMEDTNVKVDFELGSGTGSGGNNGGGGGGGVPPVAVADVFQVEGDSRLTFSVTTNDTATSGSIVTNSVTIVTQPTNGQVQVNNSGLLTYTPSIADTRAPTYSRIRCGIPTAGLRTLPPSA